MIQVERLTKLYGPHKAVSDISFNVNDKEIVGFLGPNGAGKSTTMNILTGYISATAGSVSIAGVDILEDPREAKRHIGYLPEQPPLYLDMTVMEYLNFVFDLKGADSGSRVKHLDGIAELVGLKDVRKRLIKNLSKGYRQRVGLAQALVGDPSVLILDEPTVGLDPRQITEIRRVIKNLGRTHTVILSTHILSEVTAVCERLLVISNGVIVADGTPAELTKQAAGENNFTVRVAGSQKAAAALLSNVLGVLEARPLPGQEEEDAFDFLVRSDQGFDARKSVFKALAGADMPILKLSPQGQSLEDVFLALTSQKQKKSKGGNHR